VTPGTTGAVNEAETTGNELSLAKTRESKIEESKEQADKVELPLGATMPSFPGGESALQQYIHNNLQYPEAAKQSGIEGKVYLTFTVGTSGRVKEIKIAKGVSKEINAEAIRLISNMPKWEPGKQNGKPTSMKHYLTIDFSIR
jgi:TonB family protein